MQKILAVLVLLPFSVSAAPIQDSLFFSQNELIAIMRARQGYVAPQRAMVMEAAPEGAAAPELRLIRLSGIVYNGPNDWTVWLNGERVGPKNLPDRVMGLAVEKDRVKLKWMDLNLQRVVNLTLRPHQTYDLDTDTILPSTDYR